MRRGFFGLVVLLAALLLSGSVEAQSCNGCGIGYTPPAKIGNLLATGANTTGVANGGTAGAENPQNLAAYNFCDSNATLCATGSEYVTLGYNASDQVVLNSAASGTGTVRAMYFAINGTNQIGVGAGYFFPASSDTKDIGASTNLFAVGWMSRGLQGAKTKSLTDAGAAVTFMRVAIASSAYTAGELIYATTSTDATDFRTTTGRIRYAGVNKGGTVTCTVGVVGTDLTASSNGNTLACTWTNVTATTNCDLQVTCTDNTAGTQTMTVYGRHDTPFTSTISFP